MHQRRTVITAAILVVSLLVGCKGAALPESWPVGSCVLVNDRGTTAVPCTQPHSHKVIAIVQRAEACPVETDMASQPADPDDGLTTTCFRSDTTSDWFVPPGTQPTDPPPGRP